MTDNAFFTPEERTLLLQLYKELKGKSPDWKPGDYRQVRRHLAASFARQLPSRDVFGFNPVVKDLQTALVAVDEIGLRRASVIGLLMHNVVASHALTLEDVQREYGDEVGAIVKGLIQIRRLYDKNPTIESENFRNLLLSFAEDMRVILIMIADRVNVMRQIRDTEHDEARQKVSAEASYLYAPLAHKLGLYAIKSELEDLSLKYTQPDVYYAIREKLNQTKASRDAYIDKFIAPVQQKLDEAGLKCHIKGRTKSIHSIYQKMKKQRCAFEGVYDLFAIRIIIDAPAEKEKQACWTAYSIVTDMYRPNPNRLRDWLSVPKSNGYESLHITVMGPEGKWVEVQIRTERMDEIAERGLAAHWRYKGVKSETEIDGWLNSVRETLENSDSTGAEAMDQFKMDLYEDEVFVFTPKGDLFKLPKGATVLDFAFTIHTKLGFACVGGKVNGKNASIRQVLKSGDQVEILSSSTQTPKQDWLKFVVTSRAKTKIRQALKELAAKQHAYAREEIERKFKNRKIELEEPLMMKLIKRMGFKVITDFYQKVADGELDSNYVIDKYLEAKQQEEQRTEPGSRSAGQFNLEQVQGGEADDRDVLVIDQNLKGIKYELAKCCHPIYGDDIFGFVSVSKGIKIHRTDCPNAPSMRQKYGYRIVKARWSGKSQGNSYPISLRVVGHDDIGIVTNMTSVINKEDNVMLRNIKIDAHDGLFQGNLTVLVEDTSKLDALIKKLRTIKGVKTVSRI